MAGLSPEGISLDDLWPNMLQKLQEEHIPQTEQEAFHTAKRVAEGIPSIQFALETAMLDWLGGGKKILYKNKFSKGKTCIPINGLIWMADKITMKARIDEKLAQGFTCLKLKIGAIDFKEELSLLEYIRKHYSENDLTIRVDANGAFKPEEAMLKLEQLSKWGLHSIEQPIKKGQYREMALLCSQSPIPVALDEELIGNLTREKKQGLLDQVRPPYIILKPSLLGGLASTEEWITLAEERGIGWWITSALESNIGLNAIAQFTAQYAPLIPQGLGTGQLYTNNIASPLAVKKGYLCYEQDQPWDTSLLD